MKNGVESLTLYFRHHGASSVQWPLIASTGSILSCQRQIIITFFKELFSLFQLSSSFALSAAHDKKGKLYFPGKIYRSVYTVR